MVCGGCVFGCHCSRVFGRPSSRDFELSISRDFDLASGAACNSLHVESGSVFGCIILRVFDCLHAVAVNESGGIFGTFPLARF